MDTELFNKTDKGKDENHIGVISYRSNIIDKRVIRRVKSDKKIMRLYREYKDSII